MSRPRDDEQAPTGPHGGPGRAGVTEGAGGSPGGAPHLLVVLHPGRGDDDPTRAALVAAARRAAQRVGVGLKVAAWDAAEETDLESLATAVAALARRSQPVALVLAETDIGRQLAPMVAHRLGSAAVVACADVLAAAPAREPGRRDDAVPPTPVFVKPVYGGWLEQDVRPTPSSIPVVALRVEGVPPDDEEVLPEPEPVRAEAGVPRVIRLDLRPPDPRSVDLVHATRIVAAGSGSASPALLAAVGELADLLAGSVGTTRPVVDDGRLPKERLIGQTGRTVTPELYLALGLSGSPHHVAGIRSADRIIAINRDVRAPIFRFSDVGYVADLEEVLPALIEKIAAWRDGGRDGAR